MLSVHLGNGPAIRRFQLSLCAQIQARPHHGTATDAAAYSNALVVLFIAGVAMGAVL
jgi:hypothetical protein